MIGRVRQYGVDAPPLLAALVTAALLGWAGGIAAGWLGYWLAAAPLLLAGGYFTGSAAIALHTTGRGKFRCWAAELDRLRLAGDEQALDVGCGRGAVTVALARRLPHGRVTGIDRWRSRHQSGNGPHQMLRNAAAAGVADRLRVVTADMRRLPFADASFDLVVSAMAIQKVPDPAGRAEAISELIRVLKPGGRLLVVDVTYPTAYAEVVRPHATELTVRSLGWRYSCGTPGLVSRLLSARKRATPDVAAVSSAARTTPPTRPPPAAPIAGDSGIEHPLHRRPGPASHP